MLLLKFGKRHYGWFSVHCEVLQKANQFHWTKEYNTDAQLCNLYIPSILGLILALNHDPLAHFDLSGGIQKNLLYFSVIDTSFWNLSFSKLSFSMKVTLILCLFGFQPWFETLRIKCNTTRSHMTYWSAANTGWHMIFWYYVIFFFYVKKKVQRK